MYASYAIVYTDPIDNTMRVAVNDEGFVVSPVKESPLSPQSANPFVRFSNANHVRRYTVHN